MKQIASYITEGLRINKNIKISNQIEILCKYSDIKFSKEEFDQIVENAKNLPIVPDYIYNGLKGKESNNVKHFLNLVYEPNPNNNEIRYKGYNIIRIRKNPQDNNSLKNKENFIVRFIRMDYNNTDFYPKDENSYYHSIKEVFKGIKEGWEDLQFSDSINKYK